MSKKRLKKNYGCYQLIKSIKAPLTVLLCFLKYELQFANFYIPKPHWIAMVLKHDMSFNDFTKIGH